MKVYWQYCIAIVIIAVFYIWLSVRTNSSYTIIQTSVEKLHPTMLNEKLPIVIETPIVNPDQLLQTVFKYQYIKRSFVSKLDGKNTYGYMLFYSKNDMAIVSVKHPRYFEVTKVKLYKNQILILPVLWFYNCNDHVSISGLSTFTSMFLI
jgi:hypothetical protein